MKIAFILSVFPSITTPFIFNQITGLIDKGHDVRIFAYKRGGTDVVHPEVEKYHLLDKTVFLSPEIKNKWFRWAKQLLLFPLNCVQNPRLLKCFKNLDSMKTLVWPDACELAKYYNSSDSFDVTHVQFGVDAPNLVYLQRAGLVSGILVVSYRGADAYIHLKAYPDCYNLVFQYADKLLTVSEDIKHLLIEYGAPEDKIMVHHSGIRLSEFPFSIRQFPQDCPVRLLCIARFVIFKGIDYLLEAVSCLKKRGYYVRLDILGDGQLKNDYMDKIEQLGISDIARLRGSYSWPSVLEFLQKAHILISPSIRATNKAEEGIPNVLKEAMATGLPVIATRTGGSPELVEDGKSGFLVPQKDADALAEKIIYLIEHPEIWPQMGYAGRARVEADYDSDKLNDCLEKIYQQLLVKKNEVI
ncbi:MAG: glycosyltransferase [Sedimentisphaerales bacterium]|nr:glycosyltransferase [Sedimentisphaerales bacterium]